MFKKILIVIVSLLLIGGAWGRATAQERERDDREQESEVFEDYQPAATTTTTTTTTTEPSSTAVGITPTTESTPQTATTPATSTETLAQSSLAHTKTGTPWAWYLARAAGISSLLFLVLIALSGIGVTTGWLYRYLSPTKAWWWHRAISIGLVFSVLTHVGSLLFDHYISFNIADLLVPWHTNFKPTGVALGIIGFYIFWPVILSSLYWIQSRNWWWRLLHYLTFVMFILVFYHSIVVGTDTHTWFMQLFYWVTGIAIAILTVWRIGQVVRRRI